MSVPTRLANAAGTYSGSYKLYFEPGAPVADSATNADVRIVGNGRLLEMTYDWQFKGKHHEGVLILTDDPGASRCEMAWADSFHNGHRLMPCAGALAGDGEVSVRGSYPAPSGPDWGWRTTLEQPDPDTLVMRMYNVTPDGEEQLAVDASYRRR